VHSKRGPGRRPGEQTQVYSKLAEWRVKRNVTQKELAEATGIPLATYWRLEKRRIWNPPIRHLASCAIALGCELEDLIEDQWRSWYDFSPANRPPPDVGNFWRADAE